jgi:hypothetical protein
MILNNRASRVTAMTVLAVVASCGVLFAQTNQDVARMRDKLKVGDRLTVDVGSGLRVKGKFAGVTNDTLTISTGAGQKALAMPEVTRVQRHRRGYLLGAVIGAGVGVACGLALNSLSMNESGEGAGWAALGLIGGGAAVGAGIDVLLNIPRTVYRRAPERASLVIDARPGRTGVGVAIAF